MKETTEEDLEERKNLKMLKENIVNLMKVISLLLKSVEENGVFGRI